MRCLIDYEIRDFDIFLRESEEYLERLKRTSRPDFDDFTNVWNEWLENPEDPKFNSHEVGIQYRDNGWELWRSRLNDRQLRLLYFVGHERREILVIEIRNDHDYSERTMSKIARKGKWMEKQDSSKAEKEHHRRLLKNMCNEITDACAGVMHRKTLKK